MMIASEQNKLSYCTYCCDVNGLYSKVPLPSTFVLVHTMYKYMSEPTGGKKGVKQDIKI